MARELGLHPKKLGKLANSKQEPWKLSLPAYIEKLYDKRFHKRRPDDVKSIEETVKNQRKRQARRKQQRLYRALLRQYDEEGTDAGSHDVDDRKREEKARNVVSALAQKLERLLLFEDAGCAQDASCRTAIVLAPKGDEALPSHCELRFSRVGNFVTMTDSNTLYPHECEIIISELAHAGVSYIPVEELDKAYDGVMAGAFTTWWQRCFDEKRR